MDQPSVALKVYNPAFLLTMMSVDSRAFAQFATITNPTEMSSFCQQYSLGASTASNLKVLQHLLCKLVSTSWYIYLEVPTNHISHHWHLVL